MPYTPLAKDRMLIATFAGGAVLVGLLHGEVEEADAAYRRQRVDFGEPAGEGGIRRLANLDDVRFPPYADWPVSAVDGFVLLDLSGAELAREPLPPTTFEKGDGAIFRPGDLTVKLED